MKRVTILLALGLFLWMNSPIPAQTQPPYAPPPDNPGAYILVRRPDGSFVYVPLDPYGRPAQVPGIPSAPAFPGSTRTPATPPSPPDWGYLRTEVEPRTAQVLVDGQYVGRAEQFSGPTGFLTLAAGSRRVEIDLPGHAPLSTTVEITPKQTYILKGTLKRDPFRPPATQTPPEEGGYQVVPPARERPPETPRGGGHFVVPKP